MAQNIIRLLQAAPIMDILKESETLPANQSTWEDLKKYSEKGHEFACHTISHPQLSNLDEKNIFYESWE